MEYASPFNWLVRVHGGISYQISANSWHLYTNFLRWAPTSDLCSPTNPKYIVYITPANLLLESEVGFETPPCSIFKTLCLICGNCLCCIFETCYQSQSRKFRFSKFKDLRKCRDFYNFVWCQACQRFTSSIAITMIWIHYYKLSLSYLLSDIFHTTLHTRFDRHRSNLKSLTQTSC